MLAAFGYMLSDGLHVAHQAEEDIHTHTSPPVRRKSIWGRFKQWAGPKAAEGFPDQVD